MARVPHPDPSTERQLRRRRRTRAAAGMFLGCCAALVVFDRLGCFGFRGDDLRRFDRKAYVVCAVGADATLRVRAPGGGDETSIGLIGLDVPARTGDGDAYWAEPAREYLTSNLKGKTVTLKLDPPQTRDARGRLRAYVFLGDGDDFNLDLVRDGHAYADRRTRHPFWAQFEAAEGEARKKARGLWKDVRESQLPAWRQGSKEARQP